MINLKFLRTFLAVMERGSISSAALAVGRAQSAVTRSILELEAGLGAQLFERNVHGMLPTDMAYILQSHAEKAMAEMDHARSIFLETFGPQGCNLNAPVFSLAIGHTRLLIFVQLVEQRHMGMVADHLEVSQPFVSQTLRELEQGIGVELMTRIATGMAPTATALVLAAQARRALAELRKAEDTIASLQLGMTGSVVIGTLSLGRIHLLPRAIARIVSDFPNVTVRTVEGTFEHLASLLHAGDLDFIMGALRPAEHIIGLLAETLVDDQIAVVARRDHPLANRTGIGAEELRAARWILPPRGTSTRVLLEQALGRPDVPVETADITITRDLVLQSDLLTATSPHLLRHEIDAGRMTVLSVAVPFRRRGIGLIQRSNSVLSMPSKLLIDTIRNMAGEQAL
jgi:LysR family transcriptional regulator of gallate degradation